MSEITPKIRKHFTEYFCSLAIDSEILRKMVENNDFGAIERSIADPVIKETLRGAYNSGLISSRLLSTAIKRSGALPATNRALIIENPVIHALKSFHAYKHQEDVVIWLGLMLTREGMEFCRNDVDLKTVSREAGFNGGVKSLVVLRNPQREEIYALAQRNLGGFLRVVCQSILHHSCWRPISRPLSDLLAQKNVDRVLQWTSVLTASVGFAAPMLLHLTTEEERTAVVSAAFAVLSGLAASNLKQLAGETLHYSGSGHLEANTRPGVKDKTYHFGGNYTVKIITGFNKTLCLHHGATLNATVAEVLEITVDPDDYDQYLRVAGNAAWSAQCTFSFKQESPRTTLSGQVSALSGHNYEDGASGFRIHCPRISIKG